MQDRLCGKEQEYGMRILPTKKFAAPLPLGILSPQEQLEQYLSNDFVDWRRGFAQRIVGNIMNSKIPNFPDNSERIWLANGSLIYIDLKCILEVATAECRAGSLDGLLQEKASELILNEAAQSVVAQRGIQSLTLYKNNVGPSGFGGDRFNEVSYASHHNYSYLVSRQAVIFHTLKSFLPVSIIFSGNGHVYKHRNNIVYVLSQRASHIVIAQSCGTTDNRAIVNTRDEPLMCKSTGLNRLHLISRDATRCEFQTWLVDGMTHLVLRLAEEGWKLPLNLSLNDPIAETHAINLSLEVNLDYKAACWPLGINRMDILEYNKIFLDAAKQLQPLSQQEKLCLQEWERVLELLKARAFDQLVGELDWATKWWLLKKKMSKYNFGLDDIRAWKIDMGYHDISSDPKKSWFALLEEEGKIKHLVSKEDIQKAILTPPETRAKSRGKFIRLAWEHRKLLNKIMYINWDAVCLQGNPPKYYPTGEISNPFATVSSSLENLYKELGLAAD